MADIGFAELLALPGVEEHCELRSTFGFMAYHGGALEEATDVVARAAAEQAGASYYGVHQPDGMRHHIPSTKIRPQASEALARFIGHVDVVVTIHGYGRRGFFTALLLGGRNRQLADHVAGHLRPKLPAYDIVTDVERIPPDLRGHARRQPGEPPAVRRRADRAPAAGAGFEPAVVGLGGWLGAAHRGADRRARRRCDRLVGRDRGASGASGASGPITR